MSHKKMQAANGWMGYVKSALVQQKGTEIAEAFFKSMYSLFADEASMLVAESLPGTPPLASDCQEWESILNAGTFDLEQNAEVINELKEIRAFFESGALGHGSR